MLGGVDFEVASKSIVAPNGRQDVPLQTRGLPTSMIGVSGGVIQLDGRFPNLLITGGADGKLRIWDQVRDVFRHTFQSGSGVMSQ